MADEELPEVVVTAKRPLSVWVLVGAALALAGVVYLMMQKESA